MDNTYNITNSEFDQNEPDMPPPDYILEALGEVIDAVDTEGVWTFKGNYELNFWIDSERPNIIICNAYVMMNPDDESDFRTESYCYYYEITKE